MFRRATQRIAIPLLIAALILLAGASTAAAADGDIVAQAGNASIAHDTPTGTWTLTASGATLRLGLDASRDFSVLNFTSPSGAAWTTAPAADTQVHVGSQTLAFGSRQAGFAYQGVTVASGDTTLQLNATFTLASAGLRMTRHYAVASGSPSFETWNTYEAMGSAPTLADLNGIQFTVPPGSIRWLTGLQGDNADVVNDSAFTLEQKALTIGQHFAVGATFRSSEQTVPWFAVDGSQDEFYAALMWSGAWSLAFDRTRTGLTFSFGLAPMTTTPTQAIDGPHVVFGVAVGGLAEASAALRSYVLNGIRAGRPLTPLVTYNTWFAYGTDIDEASMRNEMDHAAALGVELFVIDAGWYAGTGVDGPFDFDSGLGSWVPDPARFPNGLKPLTDYAHGLGMKFGLWVEPERTNLSLVGAGGVDEQWLATTAGGYGSDHAGQICLATAAARQWLMDRLTGLLDDVQPDYLKWDNNMFINCDRSGHGHGATDGNFAHVNGLYSMLSDLRDRYPDLLIENVSGGGNRLDLGALRYTDSAWMDDRTAPSVHVRHNLQGLGALFPPAYLLSFVTDHDTEPLHDAPDMSLYFRSRMAGALGLCFRSDELSDTDTASMATEIGIYKLMRSPVSTASAGLLTKQAEAENGPAWDVFQESASASNQVVVSAFQSNTGVSTFNVKPFGLLPQTTYDVTSVDSGPLGSATGEMLMSQGIDVVESPATAAHILILTARQ
ncbi:MAG TPA: glycoside hydrolase family 36 protein [Vicinamibacterales bacterium]